jgi:hypothetical protein
MSHMSQPDSQKPNAQPVPARGLSTKVLALTVIFVMVGEILIFLPPSPISASSG